MPNLSFWRNSKAKKKSGSRLTWVSSVWSLLFLWRRSHFQQSPFFFDLFFHLTQLVPLFSKMSLVQTHTYRCSPTSCLCVATDLLNPSFFFHSFWSAGLNFTLPSRLLEVVNTAVIVHSLRCALYHLVQHVRSEKELGHFKNTQNKSIWIWIVCDNLNLKRLMVTSLPEKRKSYP